MDNVTPFYPLFCIRFLPFSRPKMKLEGESNKSVSSTPHQSLSMVHVCTSVCMVSLSHTLPVLNMCFLFQTNNIPSHFSKFSALQTKQMEIQCKVHKVYIQQQSTLPPPQTPFTKLFLLLYTTQPDVNHACSLHAFNFKGTKWTKEKWHWFDHILYFFSCEFSNLDLKDFSEWRWREKFHSFIIHEIDFWIMDKKQNHVKVHLW